jgi:hypothetical protein
VVVSVGLTLDRDVIAVEGEVGGLAEPVRARRLTDQEGRKLQQIVRRGRHGSVRGPPGVDHHGVRVRDDGAGDRSAGGGG